MFKLRSVFSLMMIVGAAWFLAGSAVASDSTVAERIANQQSLRSSVESGEGRFARLKASDKTKLLSAQETIFAVLEGKRASSDLNGEEALRLESAEDEITRIVASLQPTAAQRTVRCSYQARIGSNRKERVCKDIHSSGDAEGRADLRELSRCKGSGGCSGRNPAS